ncbi:DUF3369 domain-containing protein [Desulfococcaceae bacterium HSG8]|nr:DUF3369 domain-containing protein [Desulfococcaceae bacterium HSG8]
MTKDDVMVFSDDDSLTGNQPFEFSGDNVLQKKEIPWKLLIVDDDEEIHALTKMVLADYSFENRPLLMFSVYSGKEAIEFLAREKAISIVLLDVVMETDDAGLKCARDIREELNNHTVRIILRTGQPGQAPEQEVIVNYDINDYKAKTELTSQKLFTVVTASLRSYRQIKTIDQNRRALENIITASHSLFELRSFSLFATGILQQLTSILRLDESSLYANSSSLSALRDIGQYEYNILAATGDFAGKENCSVDQVVPKDIRTRLLEAASKHESIFTDTTYTGYFETRKGERHLLYLQWQRTLTEVDRDLISIFATNVAIAFENISLNNEVIKTQKEVILTLSEVVEGRSKETANHIRRVAAVACMIAKKIGLSDHEVEMVRLATPMHDIGKVGTPDSILKKPGKLTAEEYEIIKKHAELGYNIFRNSASEMMISAAIIAHQHHEKWNGKGYPKGLKGEEIHIYGRITALADVVDALTSKRCYKERWDMDKVIRLLKEERGEHFDPRVVDIFLDSLDEYNEILRQYPS